MGAYNRLRATAECYRCRRSFSVVAQVHLGWCRYEEYVIGDSVLWMDAATRAESARDPELRTMVEVGSPNWDRVATSADDYQCPHCEARGTLIVVVEHNRFRSVLFTPAQLPYGEALIGDEIDTFLGSAAE